MSQQPNRPSRGPGKKGKMSLGGLLLAAVILVIAWWSNNQSLAELGTTLLSEQTGAFSTVAVVAEPTRAATAASAPPTVSAPTATLQPTQAPASATPQASATVAPPTATSPPPTATAAPPTATAVPATATSAPPTATSPPTPSPERRQSGLPTIRLAQLPPEARTTIELIETDGPFPFERDGITFQNRERLLPNRPRGYYQEYTVITPGLNHRGARRIVAGAEGELYYTDDHYASFREVIE